jgi:hypothetical protein
MKLAAMQMQDMGIGHSAQSAAWAIEALVPFEGWR